MKCEEIEVFLSGYLDGELTQQESQQVEVHLEDCLGCREIYRELREARQAAADLPIPQPSGKEWKLIEGRILEQATRSIGWVILVVWSTITVAYGIFQYAVSPEEALFEKILVFGFFLGFALLFFSILLQRIREGRADRYKGVLK